MPISIQCHGCGRTLKAPDSAAGKRARCPHCQTVVTLPTPPAPSSLDDLLNDVLGAPPQSSFQSPATPSVTTPDEDDGIPGIAPEEEPERPEPARQQVLQPATPQAMRVPARATTSSSGFARFGYLLFATVLIPLVFSLLARDEDIEERITATAQQHPQIVEKLTQDATLDDLFEAIPDHRLNGAFLGRDTWAHWAFALLAAVGFLVMIWLFFEHGGADALHLPLVALCTATVGICSLLLFQLAAEFTQGFWMRGRGFILILFYIVKFIGFSYRAASDPETGFLLSFLGFTCAVGLCEELTKAMPLLSRMGKMDKLGWRGMCLWGLASGMGFGVAEGIMYSSNYYNGLSTGGIYLVRFVSCVGLHAIWTAAVGIAMWKDRENFDQNDFGELVGPLLKVLAVPMILHGLYDTLLKREMNLYALAVAGLSFAWLIFQVETARTQDDESEVPAYRAASA